LISNKKRNIRKNNERKKNLAIGIGTAIGVALALISFGENKECKDKKL
jgi:hypothetical protein